MREPVSTSAVAMIVSEPPSSTLRAAPRTASGSEARRVQTTREHLADSGTTVLNARASRVIESSRIRTSFLSSTRRFAVSMASTASCT